MPKQNEYKSIFDSLVDPIVIVSTDGKVLEVNEKALETIQFAKKEIVGKNILQIKAIPVKSVISLSAMLARSISGEGEDVFEVEVRNKDGKLIPMEVYASKIKFKSKNAIMTIFRDISKREYVSRELEESEKEKSSMLRDIVEMITGKTSPPTDRVSGAVELALDINELKESKENLEESEKNLRNFLNNANDLIQSVDARGRFLLVNKKWKETLGYSDEDLKTMTLWDVVRKDQWPHCQEMFKRVMAGENLDHVETVFVSKNRQEIYVEGNANAFFEGDKFVSTRGIFRDITKRKLIEDSLIRTAKRFEDLVNMLPQTVFEIDAQGGLSFANRAANKAFGYSASEIQKGYSVLNFISPEDRDRAKANMLRVAKGENLGGVSYTGMKKDGTRFPVLVYSVPVFDDGAFVGMRGIIIDLSEKKEMEKLLEEAQMKFKAIVESSPDGIVIIQDEKFVFLNEKMTEMLAYSAEELMGDSFTDVVVPEKRKVILEKYKTMMSGGDVKGLVETDLLTAKAKELHVGLNASIIEYNEKPAVLVIVRDLSEMKRSGNLLRNIFLHG